MGIDEILSAMNASGKLLSLGVDETGAQTARRAEFIVLEFEKATFEVACTEDDELWVKQSDNKVHSFIHPDLVGMEALWVRTMLNQQGYRDGLMIDLGHPGEGVSRSVVVIAIGGAVQLLCCEQPQ